MKTQTISRKALGAVIFLIFSTIYENVYAQENFRANLRVVNADGSSGLLDGNMTNYDAGYSNAIDGMDVWKMTNFGENFGIYRENQNIVVERRHTILLSDTTYFRMWNMRQLTYQVEVVMKNLNHPGLTAYLEDSYLNKFSLLDLNDTTRINFTVTSDPASANEFRFRIIFQTEMTGVMPVSFTGIKAWRNNLVPVIEWTVEDEENVIQYDVERSLDGLNFIPVASTIPSSNDGGEESYKLSDQTQDGHQLFYRVKATSLSGNIVYSAVARLAGQEDAVDMMVYPNPVSGRKIQVLINNAIAGRYNVTLLSGRGLLIPVQDVQLQQGSNSISIALPSVTPGIYRLRVAGNGVAHVISISIK